MNKKTIIIIVIVLVVICLCCAVVGGAAAYFIYTTTQPAVSVGESFLESMKNDDYQKAYMLLTPNARKDVSDPVKLERFVTQEDLIPQDWNINSRSVNGKSASMGGKITTRNGDKIDYIIELRQINGQWLINYFGPKTEDGS